MCEVLQWHLWRDMVEDGWIRSTTLHDEAVLPQFCMPEVGIACMVESNLANLKLPAQVQTATMIASTRKCCG